MSEIVAILFFTLAAGACIPLGGFIARSRRLFASGGILYLIFQDIAPQSRLNRHWAPPLDAVAGFSVALFGDMVVRGG
ncbi:MAG: hypothetical protein Q7J36_05145 [Thiobacillus sp.]|nr:hypothetical protein [Thiobacillus sp.]